MAVLLFNRFPKNKIDFTEWFTGLNEDVYMFTTPEAASTFPEFPILRTFDSLAKDARVEIEAVKLFQEHRFRRLLVLEESEIIRAGLLRTRLGLEGQSYESALAFRDKVIMKEIAVAGGISVAPFRAINNGLDLHDFIEEHGLPVITKPIRGMFSLHTRVLRTMQDVEQWLKTASWQDLMAEKFVYGDVYHINGIIVEGELLFICSFAYVNTFMSYSENEGLGDRMLSVDNPLHQRFVSFTRHLLDVMPTPATTNFHLEVFLTPDDQIVLCEIASRTSGGMVSEQIQHVFGIPMDRFITRAQCGIVDPLPDVQPDHKVTASYFLPPKRGKLIQMPENVPFDFCIQYVKKGVLDRVYEGAQRPADHYALVIVEARDEQESLARMAEVVHYIEAHTLWES